MLTIVKTKLKTSLLLLLASALVLSCQHHNAHTIKGNGNIVIQTRTASESFTRIEVNNALEVIIEQDSKTKISVEADDNLQKSIETKIENRTLFISRKNGNYSSNRSQKVFIKTPVIEELSANSASSIKTKNTLKGENITLRTTSAAKIEAELSFENVKASSSSASKIELKGMALNLDVETNSAGKIEAENLLANSVVAQSSSGSKISVHPIVNLKANADSGSKIEYNNNPKHTEKTTSSGGSIELE